MSLALWIICDLVKFPARILGNSFEEASLDLMTTSSSSVRQEYWWSILMWACTGVKGCFFFLKSSLYFVLRGYCQQRFSLDFPGHRRPFDKAACTWFDAVSAQVAVGGNVNFYTFRGNSTGREWTGSNPKEPSNIYILSSPTPWLLEWHKDLASKFQELYCPLFC